MLVDYKESFARPITLVIGRNLDTEGESLDVEVHGEFSELRIKPETLPKGKEWYQTRHGDDGDWTEILTIKKGCIAVNFCGTLICDHIPDMKDCQEYEVKEWYYDD